MAQYLRELPAFAEGMGSVPRTYSRWFTTLWSSSSRGSGTLLESVSTCTQNVYTLPHTYTHIHITNSEIHLNTCRKLDNGAMTYLTSIFVMLPESIIIQK